MKQEACNSRVVDSIIYGDGFQYFEFRKRLPFQPVNYFCSEAKGTKEM